MAFQQPPVMKKVDTNAIYKASFLYNFAKMIDWPTDEKTGNFIIGVYGDSPVYKELIKKYAEKNIGTQKIEIKKLSENPDIGKVHLLYITKNKTASIPALIKNVGNQPVLIVTDSPVGIRLGSSISFVIVNHKLNFELNVSEATNHGLIIGSRLKDLAFKK